MNNDNIELPPLPPFMMAPIADKQTVRDYARAAVLADRERRAEQATPAKPKVYSTTVCLSSTGLTVWPMTSDDCCATVTLCWTDDGRAWIESEKNRELAAELRRSGLSTPSAADALDGGVR